MTVEYAHPTNRTVSSLIGACMIAFAPFPSTAFAQQHAGARGATKVALVKMPYSGARNVPELSGGPDYLEHGGIGESLRSMGVALKPTDDVRLTPEEEGDYGNWPRMGMANATWPISSPTIPGKATSPWSYSPTVHPCWACSAGYNIPARREGRARWG